MFWLRNKKLIFDYALLSKGLCVFVCFIDQDRQIMLFIKLGFFLSYGSGVLETMVSFKMVLLSTHNMFD